MEQDRPRSRTQRSQTLQRRLVALFCLVLVAASCGDAVRTGRSPMFLVIDLLESAPGNKPTQFNAGALQSDVVTLVTSGGVCTTASPCTAVYPDVGRATFRLVPKDITSPTGPTTNNEVTLTRFHVTYRRTDGRNIQGVDVPFAIDGAATGTVPASGTLALPFELVRYAAKNESPLLQLRDRGGIITTLADISFYGTDRVGNTVTVTGTIQVDFANFVDQ
jgi:hypothetical protein